MDEFITRRHWWKTKNIYNELNSKNVKWYPLIKNNKNSSVFNASWSYPVILKLVSFTSSDFEYPDHRHSIWNELSALLHINNYMENSNFHFFPYMYHYSFSVINKIPTVIILMEEFGMDFRSMCIDNDTHLSDHDWIGCFIQLFFIMYHLYYYCNICQGDLHWNNVLVKKLDSPVDMHFSIHHQSITLLNQNFHFGVCDFGNVIINPSMQQSLEDYKKFVLHVFSWIRRYKNFNRPNRASQFVHRLQSNKNWTMTDIFRNLILTNL